MLARLNVAGGLLLSVTGLAPELKGWVLMLGGGIIAMRILRWQPWQYRSRLDIVLLFAGYAGLALADLRGHGFYRQAPLRVARTMGKQDDAAW